MPRSGDWEESPEAFIVGFDELAVQFLFPACAACISISRSTRPRMASKFSSTRATISSRIFSVWSLMHVRVGMRQALNHGKPDPKIVPAAVEKPPLG
jgi:hypothetical protein